jgi:MSHA biogenesis protein MshQ
VANGRLALGTSSGSWSNGVVNAVALTANATRAAAPEGPFDAAFGIAPVDSDGVALGSFTMASSAGGANDRAGIGTVALRFGRLRLSNAVGAQTRTLALPLVGQYWSGSQFETNALDSCTSIAAGAVSFGNLRRTLTTADTALAGSSFGLSAGVGALLLAAPGGGRHGTLDVALSLGGGVTDASCLQPWTPGSGDAATSGANLAFLRGSWCSTGYDKDPSARASFGLYRGADTMLYQRENY